MYLELKIAAAIVMAGPVVFWRFEERTPVAKRILKWGSYLGITLLLFLTAGQPWSLAWAAGVPAVGLSYHVGWCRKHGIDPITAHPRDKYHALRGQK